MLWLFGQCLDSRHQFIIHPLIGIQVQLPGSRNRQVVDGPVTLGSVILKGVLNNNGPMLSRQFRGPVFAEGIHHEDLVGNLPRAGKRGAQGTFRIKSQKDDSGPHE